MKLQHVTTLCIVFALSLSATLVTVKKVSAREKQVVFVSTFEDNERSKIKIGEKARDEITNVVVALKYLTVVERSRMESIMKEMEFSNTAFADSSSAASFGKKLGAQLVVFGNVSAVSYKIEEIREGEEGKKKAIKKKGTGTATLNVQIVDVDTNATIFSESFSGEATDTVDKNGTPKPMTALVPEAIRNAAEKLWVPLQKKFPLDGIVIKKEKRDGDYYAYVDFGKNWGVTKGRRLYIYSKGEKVIHPVTGKVLSSGRGELVAKDSVDELFDEYCTANVSRREYNRIEVGMIVEALPVSYYSSTP